MAYADPRAYAAWCAANRDKKRAIAQRWAEANGDKIRAAAVARYAAAPVGGKARILKWRLENPEAYLLQKRRGDAARYLATPHWLTADQKAEIKKVYALAKASNLEIDHIVPLRNKAVCGLHVPWNLQTLSRPQNNEKGNRLLPLTVSPAWESV